jgi:hypothetical protein
MLDRNIHMSFLVIVETNIDDEITSEGEDCVARILSKYWWSLMERMKNHSLH